MTMCPTCGADVFGPHPSPRPRNLLCRACGTEFDPAGDHFLPDRPTWTDEELRNSLWPGAGPD